jgi:predicted small secreted protein
MRRAMLLLALVCAVLTSGCNTVRGVGRDIEAAGEAIQRSTK